MTLTLEKASKLLLAAGAAILVILLGKFSIDFFSEGPILGVGLAALATLTVAAAVFNAFESSAAARSNPSDRMRALLLISLPAGYLGSALGCSGLDIAGCSTLCTAIRDIGIPLIAGVSLLLYLKPDGRIATSLLVLCFVPLTPGCICYNVANRWWIDRIGASPQCYAWAFATALLALGALKRGRRIAQTAALNGVIIGGELAFFVLHHYFKYPW